MEQDNDRNMVTKKRVLFIIGFIVVAVVVTLLIINIRPNKSKSSSGGSDEDDESIIGVDADDDTIDTYSSEIEQYLIDTETYAYENHPISTLLPHINDDPYYCISYDVSGITGEEYSFKLTIEYKTSEGRKAAEELLKTPEYSQYNPSQYEIVYTKVAE